MSRKPLTNVRSYPLLAGSGRRVLVAETEVNGRQISIACVHFATNVSGDRSRSIGTHLAGSAESRMLQAGVVDSELPVKATIVGGDFNLPPRGLAYSKIIRKYRNSFRAANGFGYTYPAKMPLMRIDHILLSKDLTPVKWRAVDTGSSDHLAVIADICFKDEH
ncbi:MAG: endonuclease/exonuclease/phosphatase family protein [Armatimonadota bacterium]